MWWQASLFLALYLAPQEEGNFRKAGDGFARSAAGLPANVATDPVFRPALQRMWDRSPTFRRQCSRLALEPGVRVRVRQDEEPRPSSSHRARSAFGFERGTLATVDVYLRPSLDAPRLIAHEMEHVLEQLDGVDLEAQVGNGLVWKSDTRAFETRRAIEIGDRVASEVTGGESPETRVDAHSEEDTPLLSVRQADRDATPLSVRTARLSANGRYVVFVSSARLAQADRNGHGDIYVLDLASRGISLESVGADSEASNGESRSAGISGDGRYVIFESVAGNLIDPHFAPGIWNLFLRDRATGTTRLLTSGRDGGPADGPSGNPVISADGTKVAFESAATNLIGTAGERGVVPGVYLFDLTSGLRRRVDAIGRVEGDNGLSMSPGLSADGRFLVFASRANLTCARGSPCRTTAERKGMTDIYLHDGATHTTTRISRSHAGGDADGPSYDPAISGDGRYVAFVSEASNLTREAVERRPHIYLHDLVRGNTELISRTPSGRPAHGRSLRPALSFDGSTIAFQSLAADLLCERNCRREHADINLLWDVFVHDRRAKRTVRASASGGGEWMANSRAPVLDDAGRVLIFGSRHPFDARGEDHDEDLYVRFLDQ